MRRKWIQDLVWFEFPLSSPQEKKKKTKRMSAYILRGPIVFALAGSQWLHKEIEIVITAENL